jgi:hypothetical protein
MRGQAVGLNQLLCRTLDKVQQAQQSALEIREPGRDDELAFESIFDLELIAFRIFFGNEQSLSCPAAETRFSAIARGPAVQVEAAPLRALLQTRNR